MKNLTVWREKLRMSLEKVGWEEAALRDIQVALVDANSTQQKHEDELTFIFDKLSVFQEGVLQNIRTMTEIVDKTEASTLTGIKYQGYSHLRVLVEHISELERDRISDRLRIDGLESRLNAGDDKLAVGEMIVRSEWFQP